MNAKHLLTFGFSFISLVLASCSTSTPKALDYQGYQKTPDKMSSKITRAVSKSIPYTAERSFHGRWGGSGNVGGEPVDIMDEYFRRHDICYYLCRSGKNLDAADRELVEALEKIDPETLDPKARAYREVAIRFMNSPVSSLIGKPPSSLFIAKESEDCYFNTPEDIGEFFDIKHSGMPVSRTRQFASTASSAISSE